MSVSLRRAIERHRGQLTESDEQLIKTLLANPTQAAFSSAAELAKQVHVHPATVVRLAQKLGYRGFPELRADLQSQIIDASEPAERVRRSLAHIENADILNALVESDIAFLRDLPKHVTAAQLETAARALIAARTIFLFGQGHATALVELMDRRLRRSGFQTVPLRAQGRDLAERVLTLTREDVCLVFVFHTKPRGLTPLLERAKEVGAPCIVVSDLLGPLLRPLPKIVLAAPRGAEQEFQTLTVPMAICNALVLTIARLDNSRSLQALERLAGLMKQFEEERKERRGRNV
ncbi:MAG: MurR/RpiR family transcriptional regulator [Anaerolineales bacterium]|nr:MurR/RpiR family transcriptional regulator [Anaerolineales bacterium]